MIGNALGHSRTSTVPFDHTIAIATLTKATMGMSQIEVSLIQMHLSLKPYDFPGEGHGLSSKAAIFVSQIQVVPFDVHRLDIIKGNILKHCSSENPHHLPSFVSFFDCLTIAQRRPPFLAFSVCPSFLFGDRFQPHDGEKKERRHTRPARH